MNFFTKKNFLYKLIVCLCILFTLINFMGSQKVYAGDGSEVGGILIKPITDLVVALGDATMNLLQKSIMGTEASIQVDNSDPSWWEALVAAVIVLFVIALVVLAAIYAPGVLAAAIKAVTASLVKTAIAGAAIGLVVGFDTLASGVVAVTGLVGDTLSDTVVLPTYSIGPEEIFSGKILLFDPNIFNPKQVYVETENQEGEPGPTMPLGQWNNPNNSFKEQYNASGYYYLKNNEKIYTSINNSAYELKDIIAEWYYIIRNIALVGSMLILIYIGIRMIVSSIAEEKSKYKQMLMDWLIALCLIIFMHYIMIFAHNVTESIRDIFNHSLGKDVHIVAIDEPGDNLKKSIKSLEEESGQQYLSDDGEWINWPTNLMGKFRLKSQEVQDNLEYVGYALSFVVLVIYTLSFSFTYIKRLIYLLFLTVIAPLVALTYPIDKIHDGKAQAFNMWLKEYIFNLLIQPFHLLLYVVFVSMAFEMASTNIIYSLVAIGFMIPAEKFLRTMFGFNKASTPGFLAGAAGAALTMSAIGSLGKFARGGRGSVGHSSQNQEGGKEENNDIRTADKNNTLSSLIGGLAEQNENIDPSLNSNIEEQSQDNSNIEGHESDSLEEEGRQVEDEERILYDMEEELTTPGRDWDDGQYTAFAELEREHLERKERLRQRERLANNSQQQSPVQQQAQPVRTANNPQQQTVSQNEQRSEVTQQIERSANNRIKGNRWEATKRAFAREFNPMNITGAKTKKDAAIKLAASAAGSIVGTTAKVAGGATGAIVGAAAGIAAGDPNAVLKNATAGAATGGAVASGITNRAKSAVKGIDTQAIKKQYEKDYYGAKNYGEAMKQKADDDFMKEKEIRRLYAQKFDLDLRNKSHKEELNKIMEDAKVYRQWGVNDNSVIIKAMKSQNGTSANRTDRERIAAARLAEKSKSEEDFQTNMKRFKETPGMSAQQVENMEKLVREINDL